MYEITTSIIEKVAKIILFRYYSIYKNYGQVINIKHRIS